MELEFLSNGNGKTFDSSLFFSEHIVSLVLRGRILLTTGFLPLFPHFLDGLHYMRREQTH